MTTAVFILQLVLMAGLGWHFWQQQQTIYKVDITRVAENYAKQLLSDYINSIDILEPETTGRFIRTKYLQDAMYYGLPIEAAGQVSDIVWSRVVEAQNNTVEASGNRGFSFYD